MKTELRPAFHTRDEAPITEVWYAGQLIAVIYPAKDGAGVRVVSKLPMLVPGAAAVARVGSRVDPNVLEVALVLPCPPDAP